MGLEMKNEKWIAVNGSVMEEKTSTVRTEFKTTYVSRKYIAFNVGQKIAEHIVKLHNDSLGIT